MKRAENKRKLNTVPLPDAVLCVDCETISNSPHDECLVCGSASLLNLHRLLESSLSRGREHDNRVKYTLEITAKARDFTAQELSQAAESITRLLSSRLNGGWEELHLQVAPAVATDDKTETMAA